MKHGKLLLLLMTVFLPIDELHEIGVRGGVSIET